MQHNRIFDLIDCKSFMSFAIVSVDMTVYGHRISGGSRAKRRPDRFRRGLRKVSFFLIAASCIFFVVSLVFLWGAHFQQGTTEDRAQRALLAAFFSAGGGVSLVLYLLTLWARTMYARRKDNSRRSFSNTGSVLVWVLVIIGLSAGILLALQAGSRSLMSGAQSESEFEDLRLAASDTATHLMRVLGSDPDLLADHLLETWAEPVEIEYPSGVRTQGAVMDAQAYFDINNLTATRPVNVVETAKRILTDIMRECGISYPAQPIESVEDWVDEDGEGAYESDFYLDKTEPYRTADSAMQSLRELDWIEGWSLEMFTEQRDDDFPRLSDVLTILPEHRNTPIPVNVNTASEELLTAMLGGDNRQLVNLIVSMRSTAPLRSTEIIETAIGSERMDVLRPFLDVKSNYYRIEVLAKRKNRNFVLNALTKRDSSGEVSVLRWSY